MASTRGGYNSYVPFTIRDFQPQDFETLWRIDQGCFPPGISYSRHELKFYIGRRGSFTLVATILDDAGRRNETRITDKHGGINLNPGGQPMAADTTQAATFSAEIAGFIVSQAGAIGHVITIDVVSSARRSGVGSQLLQAAEDRLRTDGSRAVALETAVDNSAALSFYKRNGYSVTKSLPRYYSNGTDALVLRKELI